MPKSLPVTPPLALDTKLLLAFIKAKNEIVKESTSPLLSVNVALSGSEAHAFYHRIVGRRYKVKVVIEMSVL